MAIVLLFILSVVAAALWWGWVVMLLMGVLHHEVSQAIPAIGFGPSVIIGFLLWLLFGAFNRGD